VDTVIHFFRNYCVSNILVHSHLEYLKKPLIFVREFRKLCIQQNA